MIGVWSIFMWFFFLLSIFCGWMIIRNSGKTETNRRLKNVEKQLDKLNELAIKIDKTNELLQDLINDIREDKDERNKPK